MRLTSMVWLALWGALISASPALAETRRIAVVVGNNAGSGDMPPLRYAENDAGKMARVLAELGDVSPDDVLLLQGRRVADLERALADATERVTSFHKSPDVRTVVVFFFSGHSDGEAIELGREKLTYSRLKALLSSTGADVRLAIVDACRSGGGLREKGGRPVTPFTIRINDMLTASGEAFITSSAADEAALESSEVMGSYFTHHFISGLRGAADASGDKAVTLAEAYRYAYDRTVTATSVLPIGAQHPSYDFKLSGQGELVLSSLVRPSALLVLPEGSERSLVSDVARDQVVVEVAAGNAREVALAPGHYAVRLFKGNHSYGGRVSLTEGLRRTVTWSELTLLVPNVIIAAAKGGSSSVTQTQAVVEPVDDVAPLGLTLGVGMTGRVLVDPSRPGGFKYQGRLGFEPLSTHLGSFNLFGRPRLGAVRAKGELVIGLLGEMTFDQPVTGQREAVNEGGGQLRLGYRFAFEWRRLSLGIGAEIGVGALAQLYDTRPVTTVLMMAPRLSLRLRLAGPLSLTVDGEIPVTGVTIKDDQGEALKWLVSGAASAGFLVSF